ncbi:C39 family peptidase [Prosthecobacter sp. SYSU 5D2]|uniref:C39 family peptidase n=1 Tax=Prosthecobacter sp. SYSU 5D2 TaxID=3134134 RepID=UPI0031FF372A
MSISGRILLSLLLFQTLVLGQNAHGQDSIHVSLALEWHNPYEVPLGNLKALLDPVSAHVKSNGNPAVTSDGKIREKLNWFVGADENRKVTVFNDQFVIHNIAVCTLDAIPCRYELLLKNVGDQETTMRMVQQFLTEALQLEPQTGSIVSRGPPETRRKLLIWRHAEQTVMVSALGEDRMQISMTSKIYESELRPSVPSVAGSNPPRLEKAIDLDFLLNFGELWQCTTEAFEQKYRAMKVKDQGPPPDFEWLSADKSRARFSRKLFANVDMKLTLFAKSVKLDEAVVEFVDGRAARVTMSLYNRGDSGDIQPDKFDEIFKTTGKNLGQVLNVTPRNISQTTTSAVKTVSWQWTSPLGIALLEHNDYRTGRSIGKPEFLRMKLANPQQADWSIGKLSVGVQRMALMKNITKSDEGDVYISGVPMVDQGTKGYCVAASCQRLFEYMQIPCDQHEIAQLVDVDAVSGANIFDMQKSLAKIDGHYKVTFKPHINPEQYYSTAGKRRISQRQFAVIIKEHVDKAVPLLWALQLGRFPEKPPLPNGGQVSGGHMRMIIGYNAASKEVIFSDSWGAGHEVKRMSEEHAYEVTVGLYTMSPRGL